MELKDGMKIDDIKYEELSDTDKDVFNQYMDKIEDALKQLTSSYDMITLGLNQVLNHASMNQKKKDRLVKKIRKDIIYGLLKSKDIIDIHDSEGNEHTKRSLQLCSTDELLALLKQNIELLDMYVNSKNTNIKIE